MAARTTQKRNRVFLSSGIRTPFIKAGNQFSSLFAHDLGRLCLTELIYRSEIDEKHIDEIVIGNVAQPSEVSNIARVVSLSCGLSERIPAYTVQRNCVSGMQALCDAFDHITSGRSRCVISGAVDSVSNIPLKTNRQMSEMYARIAAEKSIIDKVKLLKSFRLEYLQPVVSILRYLRDGYSGISMGETAEFISQVCHITRSEQDKWALRSHRRATEAQNKGVFATETFPVFIKPQFGRAIERDMSIRFHQSLKALEQLRAVHDREVGTVTKGNMAPLADGAAATLLVKGEAAQEWNIDRSIAIRGYGVGALAPQYMGLAPIVAMKRALENTRLTLGDIELFEINELYSAHILALLKTINQNLPVNSSIVELKGTIPPEKVNVNGGAIALGHNLSASSLRIVLHLANEMKRRQISLGMAAAAANGGQAMAVILEQL